MPNTTTPPRPIPDEAQRQAILHDLQTTMLVEAAAGTGKTTAMVGRMIALLKTGTCKHVGSMAAVTFTRKAAAELRSRFQVTLEEAVERESGAERENLRNALDRMEQCFIGTIHSFCGRLLRERPVEAGIDPTFQELDEDGDRRLKQEAWERYCASLIAEDGANVSAELARVGVPLNALKDAFFRFVDFPDVDVWPVPTGGPDIDGLNRIREQVLEYARHMNDLIPRMPEDPGTDKLMDKYRRVVRMCRYSRGLEDISQLVRVLEELQSPAKPVQREWMKEGTFEKDEVKKEERGWNEFRSDVALEGLRICAELRYGPSMKVFEQAERIYDDLRMSRGLLSYQDLLIKAAELLRSHEHIRRYFRERFTHLLVDEFQDTDPVQAEVLMSIASDNTQCDDWRRTRPRPGSLFVVGDPKQSIYRFRRADIATYNEVKGIIASRGGAIVQLSTNFRTVEPIVDWVNSVFEPNEDCTAQASDIVNRFPDREFDESPGYVKLEAGRTDGLDGTLCGVYSLTVPEDMKVDEATLYEADRIARIIRHAVDSPSVTVPRTRGETEAGESNRPRYGDFLIINYKKDRLTAYARALQEYGIPFQVTGGTALKEIHELYLLHLCLAALARPDDPVALVAALRSELFGFSDRWLYQFKKAGGNFSFYSSVPSHTPEPIPGIFSDVFARLRQYALWSSNLPAVTTVMKIADDLGLSARAASGPGGAMEAGGFAKAIEVIRSFAGDSWSFSHVVEHLGRIVDGSESYDGMSALSDELPAVRIMNLHKVKGLEAPVVFLAGISGEGAHDPVIHVDRTESRTTGYIHVYKPFGRFNHKHSIAHPEGWNEISEKEENFLQAEKLRLRYVAATRAGAALIVTNKAGKKGGGPWRSFRDRLSPDREISDPSVNRPEAPVEESWSADDVDRALAEVNDRRIQTLGPTYDSQPAKTFALEREQFDETTVIPTEPATTVQDALPTVEGEYGVEWGSAIHGLLQTAMENPDADLKRSASTLLAQHELDENLADDAVAVVTAVIGSDLWQRATNASHRLIECPFQVMLPPEEIEGSDLPTIIRGAVDLAFKEEGGWVLVDYKTDAVKASTVRAKVAHYARQVSFYARMWERCTGEAVKEKGLFFVRTGEFHPVG